MKKNKLKASTKNKVIQHLNKDKKEFREQIKEDVQLKKELKRNK